MIQYRNNFIQPLIFHLLSQYVGNFPDDWIFFDHPLLAGFMLGKKKKRQSLIQTFLNHFLILPQ